MTNQDTFYDIHMHAFNLSHPSFTAFLKRFKFRVFWLALGALLSPLLIIPWVPQLFVKFANRILRKVRNLLSVMETDIGSFFLITENCLRERPNQLLKNQSMEVGGTTYQRVVLTPLMMDFGFKGKRIDKTIHYQPGEKPIVSQVVDIFNAIKKYRNSGYTKKLVEKYPFLENGTERIIEIYPFLGLNTANYDRERLKEMLEKYFHDYQRKRIALSENAGKFDGDIEHLTVNYFAGIKVYPPLGFDPWPDDSESEKFPLAENCELVKAQYLYEYCSEKGIPITCHGSRGGFVAVNRKQLKDFTDISKWENVLAKYPSLILNIAHFPANGRKFGIFTPIEQDRLKSIMALVLKYEKVYVDFAMRGTSDKYYRQIRRIIDSIPDKNQREKLTERMLFGSDFSINLFSVDSYNQYIQVFSGTPHLTPDEKRLFCSVNPERFLFS
jgi:hypothetical protein